MKLQLLIRTITMVSVILLCTGIGVYSFWYLDKEEHRQDFNLYALVPQDAVAVLETDYVERLIGDVEQLSCSRDGHYLHVSELFVQLKKHLQALLKSAPHGLSKQMNRMLLSFHAPDAPLNQVLYCGLGTGDYDLVESFFNKHFSKVFPLKTFRYRGKEIYIYPMEDGLFLSVYLARHFMVASFQKRMVEQVIDTYLDKERSLLAQPDFSSAYAGKRVGASATLYVDLKAVEMGASADSLKTYAPLAGWCEFDLQLDGDVIYFAGMCRDADTLRNSYANALLGQPPLEDFPHAYLPSTTFYYHCMAFADKKAVFRYVDSLDAVLPEDDYVRLRNREYAGFLADYGGESMITAFFMPESATAGRPCAVWIVPLKNELSAERRLRSLLYALPRDKRLSEADAPSLQHYLYYSGSRRLRAYRLPGSTLLAQFAGITAAPFPTVACFYGGCLLVAPDMHSLAAYVGAIEEGKQLDIAVDTEWLETLSPSYNSLAVADLERFSGLPADYLRQVPSFFLDHADFFSHFLMAAQFTCVDGVVYPCLTLFYKHPSRG